MLPCDAQPGTRSPTCRTDQSFRNRFGARDQKSIDPDLEPRGGYNNEVATQLDASDLIGFVRLALTKLDGEQREGFLMSLTDLLSEDSPTANVPDNNQQSLDRGMRSGRRTARDEGNGYIAGRFGQGGSPNTKQPAQDRAISNQVRSLNAKSFDNRFGAITRHIIRGGFANISTLPNGVIRQKSYTIDFITAHAWVPMT